MTILRYLEIVLLKFYKINNTLNINKIVFYFFIYEDHSQKIRK